MLFGRHGECLQLARALDDARQGTSRTVIVRGEAGMGKSALLDFVVSRASGFDVVSVTGVESESDLPFGALLGICRGLLPLLDRIPAAQRRALEAALALSPGEVLDRFTAYAGVLSLLAAAAEARPRLVVVDDLQWLDAPSAEAMLFVARRLGPDRVAIVLSARTGDVDRLDLAGLEEISLDGLDAASSLELLRSRYAPDALSEEVAQRLIALTGGAPLALVEVPGLLTASQLLGEEPIPDPLPAGEAVQRAFRREIDALPAATTDALLLLAAEDGGSIDLVVAALAKRGADAVVLEPAERTGLVRIEDGRGVFRHPLLRSALYHGATPSARRAAHRDLAGVCETGDDERRAWHLAAASIGPDEDVAAALERAAASAQARGGHASAARALERAAQLTPGPDARAARLLAAAESAWRIGDFAATSRLLDEATSLTDDPVRLADVQLLRGRIGYTHGSASETYERLRDGAAAVTAVAPEKAAALLAEACWTYFGAPELERALQTADEALRIGRRVGGNVELSAMVAMAMALILHGRAREARPLLARWKESVVTERYVFALRLNPTIGAVYVAAEDFSFARHLMETFVAAARSAPELLPVVLACLTQYEFRTGDWAAAYAHGTEGAELGTSLRQQSTMSIAVANLAIVEAGLGLEATHEHAREVREMVARTGHRALLSYVGSAVGLLELGNGNIESAILELEDVERMMRDWGVRDPNTVQWMPDLIEAYVRAGRRRQAEVLLATLVEQAEETDGNWARATASRCAGLLAEAFDAHFLRALDLHAAMPTPFERARTQLCFGERLRRAGRRTEARAQLRSAVRTFDRLGAAPWRQRAAAELGVSAEHLAPHDRAVEHLSPQELQVALLVAEGATNREAAEALFVTTKTVEFHLRNVFRKLSVRSRTDLARLVMARRVGTAHDADSGLNAGD
jgi:DNA-binding CsgD family transcriptional regulator